MKNGLIGAGIAGALLIGGYSLLSDSSSSSNPFDRPEYNEDTYTRTDNPSETRAYLSTGGEDKDCADFSTQRAAQNFFIANGGPTDDPHNLDRDGDGRVCESLP